MGKKSAATRNEAAAQARAKAQAQVRAQERKTTAIIIGSVLVALALFAAIVVFIMNQSEVVDADVTVADETFGIPVGQSGVVGEEVPTDAIRVDVYADYMCGACARFEEVVASDLDELREAGTIELFYHPVAILDANTGGSSTASAAAAAAVAEGAPEHFLDFQHALFANQPTTQADLWTGQRLQDLASSVGVPGDVVEDIGLGGYRGWVRAATNQASVDGLQYTPTVMIDRTILSQDELPYFEPGLLRQYLEALAAE